MEPFQCEQYEKPIHTIEWNDLISFVSLRETTSTLCVMDN